jgi:hypothetical protein
MKGQDVSSNGFKYQVLEQGSNGSGKAWIILECPCCGIEVKAYRWSLAGSGKRCTCGALHTRTGTFPASEDPGPWGPGAMYL